MTGIRVYADVLMGPLPFCVAANLPTSRIAVKGILARKSKKPAPSGNFRQQSKSSTPSANFRQFVTLPASRSISWINSKGVVYHEGHDRRTFPCDVGLKRAIESSSPEMQRAQISALREGALASAGLLVGIVPWGIVAGVALVEAGLTQPHAR